MIVVAAFEPPTVVSGLDDVAVVGQPTVPFKPSDVTAYEVGAKSKFLNDRLTLGVSLFYNDVSNGQLVGYDLSALPITFKFVNQDYHSYGGEIEARAMVGPGLTIGAGIGLAVSKLDATTADTAMLGAKEGNRTPNIPRFTVNADIDYRFMESFYANLQYQYVGERAMDLANTQDLPDYHMVNARIGWSKDNLEIYAFATNILDERPIFFGSPYSASVSTAAVGPRRTLGLGISRNF